jgi:hypothetical protein
MIEARAVSAKASFEGRMFLYEQPELLTKEDHGGRKSRSSKVPG